jgi:hypothetical protein
LTILPYLIRGKYLLSIAAVAVLFPLSTYADPDPLPADPTILGWVEQVSADSLFAHVSTLVDFYTRHTYSDTVSNATGIGAARRWMWSRFSETGASAEFFPWNGYWNGNPVPCFNIHVTATGIMADPPLIILGSHIDSRAASINDVTAFAPGADDNGSATAALLEVSRILSGVDLQNSLVMAAFTGEEQGLLGSAAYAQALWNSGASICGMINMDMIGHIVHPTGAVDSTTVRCFSGPPQESPSRQLARYVKWVGESYSNGLTVTLIDALDRPGRSGDHVSFYNLGYPSVRIMETAEDVAYQHGSSDIPENMSFSYAAKVTRLVLGVAATMAITRPPPPAPSVLNGGDGESLIISWPDSLNPLPGEVIRVAYRPSGDLYWQDIIASPVPSPLIIGGLSENQVYWISLSVSRDGLPSPFSLEAPCMPQSALPPDDFETTSTPMGVQMIWTPRQEPNSLEYIIERSIPGGEFAQVAVVAHPGANWFDSDLETGQLYRYRIKTRTQQMLVGPPSPVQKGQLATHHLGIIIVDATPDGPGSPGWPNDPEVDDYYDEILSPYDVATRWDRRDSVSIGITISDADLAPYFLVFLHIDALNASIGSDTTALRKYLLNGGILFLGGWRMSYAVEGRSGYEHGFALGDFLYDLAGIDSIRVQQPPPTEMVGAIGASGYPDVELDTVRFPNWSAGLPLCDAIWTESFPPGITEIATFNAASGGSSPFNGRTVGLKGDDGILSWVLIDVPLFYMTQASAADFIHHALDDLNAPPSGVRQGESSNVPSAFHLSPPYPNPFNSNTVIRFVLPETGSASLTVYDVLGRKVATLFHSRSSGRSYQVVFDGSSLSSGLYFAVLKSENFTEVEKIVLLK